MEAARYLLGEAADAARQPVKRLVRRLAGAVRDAEDQELRHDRRVADGHMHLAL